MRNSGILFFHLQGFIYPPDKNRQRNDAKEHGEIRDEDTSVNCSRGTDQDKKENVVNKIRNYQKPDDTQ
jgi:hypothetical protein